MIKPIPVRDVRKALLQKGFVEASKKSDHQFFVYFIDGKKEHFFFKISHGAREIRADEIRNSARQFAAVTGDDLYRVLCCEYDAKKTREIVDRHLATLLE